MILLALGSNLHGPWGCPIRTLDRAVQELEIVSLQAVGKSKWYRTEPYGQQTQPAFVNGVISVHTHLPPHALLEKCHHIERMAGRVRRQRWGPRTLDIDLIAYHEVVAGVRGRRGGADSAQFIPLTLPHPGIADRPFVLVPILEIAPFWHHPVTGKTAFQMLANLRGKRQGSVLEAL